MAAALLAAPSGRGSLSLAWWIAGGALVAAGESLRLWGVRHIGVISRTRSDRLGPLVTTGPFAHLRNPLYLGNLFIWAGFVIGVRSVWLTPIVLALLALEYHAIVRWEEELLATRLGAEYRQYAARVPRWLPAFSRRGQPVTTNVFAWREALFSERGTLIAISVGCLLTWLKARS